jgi:hypothetical protein
MRVILGSRTDASIETTSRGREILDGRGYAAPVGDPSPNRPSPAGRVFCSAISSARDEPLAGTASRIDHWILVEYRGPWHRDVIGGSLLSAELKAHLREQLSSLAHSRLLFVRKPERRALRGRRVFFGSSRPGVERLFELEVEHQDDLRELDFVAALERGETDGVSPSSSLFVVCTHGKRDACCARHGRPLYEALCDAVDPETVWQSTHVGGDRFAGNVVILPDGLYYGRVAPADVAGLLAARADGRVDLDRYRGRSRYSFAVQSAEHWIRERTGLTGVDDLILVGVVRGEDGVTTVRFRTNGSAIHEVEVVVGQLDEAAYLTCGSPEPRHARRCVERAYRVLSE